MKFVIASCCFLFFAYAGFAQQQLVSKPVIDSAAINHWPSIGASRAISNDGKYFMYSIDNQPMGNNTMIIKSTEGSWQKEFIGITAGVFSGDNKEFIFQEADTLFFLSLGKDGIVKIPGVAFYNEPPKGKSRWLVYQLNNENKELVIKDFMTNQEEHFSRVKGYAFDDAMTKILMVTNSGLECASLQNGKVSELWSQSDHLGSTIGGYAMDKLGTQVSFLTTAIKDRIEANTIWYYKEGMSSALKKVTDESEGIEPGLKVASSSPSFSGDGHSIYFFLTGNQKTLKPAADAVSVDVWNWQDSVLQEMQLSSRNHPSPLTFYASINTKDERVIQLQYENERIQTYFVQGNYIVIAKNNNPGDRFWLNKPDSNWLVSVRDGSRVLLPVKSYSEFYFSPDGQYLVYYDTMHDGPFSSYDLKTGQTRRISTGIPAHWLTLSDDFLCSEPLQHRPIYPPVGLAGWEPADTSLLVYDNYDIWKLSLNSSKPPVNITQGFGRKHQIKLRYAEQDGADRICKQNESVLLTAFNTETKYNGFYMLSITGKNNPIPLTMGPWTLYHNPGGNEFDNAGMQPLKAEYAKSWVVLRTTATESPNYFLTKDFKTYKPLTDIQPQKNYNWLTSELVSWAQPDGITTQGILYKPEDFDPNKKYPVIIHYYMQFSNRLYEYPQPEYTGSGHINIPWFVSHGYLVFTPDIYYHLYETGQSATTTVESAGRMLSKLPYVDSLRMGIAGHSWGGAETNYIVTHTHLFAAALSGGTGHLGVDLIGSSLKIYNTGSGPLNILGRCEQTDVGSTLWQRPDLWIRQSPIFQADQVTTPFLIFHNRADFDWERAVELFIALRRLEKPVWMLQYDHGAHDVGGKGAEDFTIRATQFFDHYLKGAPEPVWMSKGIRAADKMVKNGLELDTDNPNGISVQNNN